MSCSPKTLRMRPGSPPGLQAQSRASEASSIAALRPARQQVRTCPLNGTLWCRHPRSLQDHVEVGPDPSDILAEILALAHRDHVGAFTSEERRVGRECRSR